MARYDNTYSRLVAWLKILLPLTALAILSTLFLVARSPDPGQAIPYSDAELAEISQVQRVGRPRFAAVLANGTAISVAATEARPEPGQEGRIVGSDILVDLDLGGESGGRAEFRAERMILDTIAERATLSGGVDSRWPNGYAMRTETLAVALDSALVSAAGGVAAEAHATTLVANSFELTGDGSETAPYQLVFTGDVKLLYDAEGAVSETGVNTKKSPRNDEATESPEDEPVSGTFVTLGLDGSDAGLPIEIRSRELRVSQADGSATFLGDARVRRGKLRLKAAQLRAVREPGGNPAAGISVIRATRGVAFEGPDGLAESEAATYRPDTGILNMSGGVTISREGNAMTADGLVLDTFTGDGRMEGRVRTMLRAGGG